MTKTKTYLGDSVYAMWDGYSIMVYLDNGLGPKNSILLEPEVVANLTTFAKQCYMDELTKKEGENVR